MASEALTQQRSHSEQGFCETQGLKTGLSRPDIRILYALAAGLTIKEVAMLEGVSLHRVQNRLRKLRARYAARTTTELVAMALALSWIEPAHTPDGGHS